MKFSPFIVLLLPLWIYIYRFGIKVIRNEAIPLEYFVGLSGRKRIKYMRGLSARVFGYSTLIGGILVSMGLLSTVYSEPAPHFAGILYIILCPMGIVVNVFGTLLGVSLSKGDR